MSTRATWSVWMAASMLVGLGLAAGACERESNERHDHADEHIEGHDHHAEDHGHGGEETATITRWSERHELFAEHPVAQAGKPLEVLAHLTVLDGFRALTGTRVKLTLEGPATVAAEAAGPVRPGIYRLQLTPPRPGTYRGQLEVGGAVPDVVAGIVIEVQGAAGGEQAKATTDEHEHEREHEHEHANEHGHEHANEPGHAHDDRPAAAPPVDHDSLIELLKEQQWGVPFGTAFARRGTLTASIEVGGSVATPPGGSAEVGAPVAGRLVAPPSGLPRPGDAVRAGQLLATLAPSPSSPEEAARARLLVSEAEARLSRARAEVDRATRLVADQALSQRELDDARRELGVAEESVRSAHDTEQLFRGAAAGKGGGSFRLLAPIAGTLTTVQAAPGAAVAPGAVLFRIVDARELWIVARLPEADAARFRADADASFQLPGVPDSLPIDVTGDDAGAQLVTVSRAVDPASRTVDVIYALRTPDPRLRVGGLLQVSVPVGGDFEGVVVPAGALVDDDGRSVVYVQRDGEHFEARQVRAGPRQGDTVGILEGLHADERVVTRGAHVVRLQDRGKSTAAHGHIH